MFQSSRKQSIVTNARDEGGSYREFFPGPDPGPDRPASTSLDGWSADDLLAEALKREAEDTVALREMETRVLGALLESIDRG